MKRALLLLILAQSLPLAAQTPADYPVKPVRLIVGFPAGGPPDLVARLLSAGLRDILKQSFIVENRTGAGGNIGSQHVAQSAPDGYTLLVVTGSLAVNPFMYTNPGYDVEKDFEPIGLLVTQANAIAVHPSLPVRTLADVRNLVRRQKATFASGGVGTTSDLSATYLFRVVWKADVASVPYRGAGPAGVALASGETPIGFMSITGLLPLHQQGRVKILAVVSDARATVLPNVPTLAELGYPQLSPSWTAMFAPAGTPAAIVQKLNAAINEVSAAPDYRDKLNQQAMTLATGTPQRLADFLREEVARWRKIVQAVGAKPQ